MWPRSHSNYRGLTLIEIMIGMAIVMILAGMATPNLSEALENAEVVALEQQLLRTRAGIDFYTFQHEEQFPGLDNSGATGWSASTLQGQLLLATDKDGNTAAPSTDGYFYGPYLTDSFPRNPFSNLTTVHLVQPGTNFSQPDNTTGWVYWADTGVIRANTSGTTPDGTPLFNL